MEESAWPNDAAPPVFACSIHVDFRVGGPVRGCSHFPGDDGPYRPRPPEPHGASRVVDLLYRVVDLCNRGASYLPDVRHYTACVQDRRRGGSRTDRAGYAACTA